MLKCRLESCHLPSPLPRQGREGEKDPVEARAPSGLEGCVSAIEPVTQARDAEVRRKGLVVEIMVLWRGVDEGKVIAGVNDRGVDDSKEREEVEDACVCPRTH